MRQAKKECSPSAFGEEIVLAIDMDHPVLEDTLPFVLYTRDLLHTRTRKEKPFGLCLNHDQDD